MTQSIPKWQEFQRPYPPLLGGRGFWGLASGRQRMQTALNQTARTVESQFMDNILMEYIIPVIVLAVLAIPIALAIWLIARANQAKQNIERLARRLDALAPENLPRSQVKLDTAQLSSRLDALEMELLLLKQDRESAGRAEPAPATPPAFVAPTVVPQEPVAAPLSPIPPPAIPPKIRPALERLVSASAAIPPTPLAPAPASAPPPTPLPSPPAPPLPPAPPRPAAPAVNWEQFMGVKGFAWIGGFALFLGIVFSIQYAYAHNLISHELQAGAGFLIGLGVLVVGVVMSHKNLSALSQTLCATGVVILYTVTFSCHAIYRFSFFGLVPTFLLMVLITVTAFLLAARFDALVVALLGMLGGFLTPILLSTGQDNPFGLFGYIAILDTGLILVALYRRWFFLTALAALGTAVLQILWAGKFFVAEKYFDGNKILVALAVLLFFNALYLAAAWRAKIREPAGGEKPAGVYWPAIPAKTWLSASMLGLVAVALAFTAWFLSFQPLAHRPWLMFSFVFLLDLGVVATVLADETIAAAQPIAGFAVFGLLASWTQDSLRNETLNAALAFYLVFAILHSALPALLQRWRGVAARGWAIHIFPLLALVLVLLPIFRLAEVSFLVWPFILLVDLLAIALAVLTAALWPVLAVLLLTLAATGMLIFKIPADLTGLPVSFFLLGAFVVFFVAASIWLVRKFKPEALTTGIQFEGDPSTPGEVAAILPACSVVLPFLLLIMAALRLPLVNPAPVFGLGMLLVVLLLGVTKLFLLDWMPAVGLVCVAALECAWHFSRFNPANPNQPLNLVLAWYLAFFAVFALFPFLFLRRFASKAAPWAAAAMAGPLQFFLIHRFVKAVYPNHVMGLLPAAFAIPGLLSLATVLKKISADEKARLAQTAWFGGVALFFITLIFPIQFERQWITIGWALEGAALLWLFHRVAHPGLRLAGAGLLAAAFVRLALNPAVLEYHPRAATPLFNWYLYAYGIVTAALFAGAKLLDPPRNIVMRSNAQPILYTLGTVLAFLLLNIEIADYFSAPGSTLTFQFEGNFGRDMTYSIGWALFALALLVAGILKKVPAARYGAIGLLCVTLLKLFFHDLAQLDQLFRIGAFIGVAVIAMLASFAYHKFFSAARTKEGP